MKKIFLAATFIIACSLTGVAQNADKLLGNSKWYANTELGSANITLTKTAPAKYEFDMQLLNDVVMQYGKIAKQDLSDVEGREIKAGTYYKETGYVYSVTGNTLFIRYEPKSWSYNVKTLKNGDLLLEVIQSTSKGATK